MTRFLVIAFGISWLLWSPLVLGSSHSWTLYYAGVIGPAAAAFLCAPREELLRRITHWRVPMRWYAVAILLPFAIRAVAAIGTSIEFRPAEEIARVALLMLLLVPFEEIGWRGFALPRLERRFSPFVASLIVAGIWALWHLPLAWASVGYQRSDEPWRYMAWFTLTIIPISCLMTWLFHRTGESVIVASLLHAAINMADFVLVLPSRDGEVALLATSVVTALVVGVAWRLAPPLTPPSRPA